MVADVDRAAEHLKVLTRQLLAFGRKQMLELRRTDLRDVVTRFEPILRRTMNGKEVYQRLESMRKGLRVLYMSGYAADVIVHRGIVDKEVHFIQKPLSIEALSRKIRAILDSAPCLGYQ